MSASPISQLQGFANGAEHLLAELMRLDLMLQRQVLRLRAANLLTEDEFRGLYIPDDQIDALLSHARGLRADLPLIDDELTGTQALTELIEQVREENEALVQASLRAGVSLPLPCLADLFKLTPFEIEVLLICVAPEVNLRYETLFAYVQNDITKKRPTVDLTLKLLSTSVEDRLAHLAAFSPTGAIFRQHLVRLFDDPQDRQPPLPARFMKVDQRLVDFLLDRDVVDRRLLSFTRRVEPAHRIKDLALPIELSQQLTQALQPLAFGGGIFFFHGPYGVGKQAAAEAVCAELELPLLVVDVCQALQADLPLATTTALLRREATLQEAGIYLAHFEALLADTKRSHEYVATLFRELVDTKRSIFLGSETPWYPSRLWSDWMNIGDPPYFLSFDFPLPTFSDRVQLWDQILHRSNRRLAAEVEIDAIANKFVLSAGQIQDAANQAGNLTATRVAAQRDISMDDLYTAARNQSNSSLRRLAHKIEPIYRWSDIVLPPRAMRQLKEVYASVRQRHIVYTSWGFERKLALGKGINTLFSGSSGTGKTMAAQILANELNLDLYKIDLSSVVSKYIGETEKNLEQIFRAAQTSNAILFFDEADALFGKRSEVKDAHDRYANIEVAYLLQKMEEYDGFTILATNLRKNMDEAFTRRMHHIVELPFPDAKYRKRIWQGMFPDEAPLADDVDLAFLARQFDLAGGNIRNVALAAAFMAAEADGTICMEHLILATAREIEKIGRLPSQSDFRQFYELLRERS